MGPVIPFLCGLLFPYLFAVKQYNCQIPRRLADHDGLLQTSIIYLNGVFPRCCDLDIVHEGRGGVLFSRARYLASARVPDKPHSGVRVFAEARTVQR